MLKSAKRQLYPNTSVDAMEVRILRGGFSGEPLVSDPQCLDCFGGGQLNIYQRSSKIRLRHAIRYSQSL